jgi:hypothetical protein
MKNSLKTVLTAGLLVVLVGASLTFCTSKTDKPVAENQDAVEVDSALVVTADSMATATPEDSTVSK